MMTRSNPRKRRFPRGFLCICWSSTLRAAPGRPEGFPKNGSSRYSTRARDCFPQESLLLQCCCGEGGARSCWSGGRHFIACCSHRLEECGGFRIPRLHVISFGLPTDATAILAHSVLHWFGTPLLVFGMHRDDEPLPYRLPENGATPLIRKLVLSAEVLQELPTEDFALYIDATDTLVQRGGAAELLRAYHAVVHRAQRSGVDGSDSWGLGREPVVFGGQGHCHPFEVWASQKGSAAEAPEGHEDGPFKPGKVWNERYRTREYGRSGAGRRLLGGEAVCAVVNGTGRLPFGDSGVWLGRVASARRLFGVLLSVAAAEGAGHCMEALKLTQAWFPGLALVDTEGQLFWTTELELPAEQGYEVSEGHPSVQRIRGMTQRRLCAMNGDKEQSYWDSSGQPSTIWGQGSAPFVLHHAGPAKAYLVKRCSAAYAVDFIRDASDRWSFQDLDAGHSVRLSLPGQYLAVLDQLGHIAWEETWAEAVREAGHP